MSKLFVYDPGANGKLMVRLAGVSGLANVYMSEDSLAYGGSFVLKLDGIGDGLYTVSGLVNDRWYIITLVDDDGLCLQFCRERPTDRRAYYDLNLQREGTTPYIEGRTTGYRDKVTVVRAIRITDKIFLYERQPHRTSASEERDVFVCVCSPGDLEAYPEDEPGSGIPPFFRKNYTDLVFRSAQEVEDSYEAIRNDVRELVLEMERLRELSRFSLERIWAGEVVPLPSSSSSSSSLSPAPVPSSSPSSSLAPSPVSSSSPSSSLAPEPVSSSESSQSSLSMSSSSLTP